LSTASPRASRAIRSPRCRCRRGRAWPWSLVLGVTWGMLLGASAVHRILGNSGASVAIRILALILASLAVEMLVQALRVAGLTGHAAA